MKFSGLALAALAFAACDPVAAQALSGRVTSAEEGPMEGVLVSARGAGSTITHTVVTGRDGRFAFPRGTLTAGRQEISIRATGYELEGPAAADEIGRAHV